MWETFFLFVLVQIQMKMRNIECALRNSLEKKIIDKIMEERRILDENLKFDA